MKEMRSVPLLKDVAVEVGVSIMTVSNVLRVDDRAEGPSLYSEETARRVRAAARKLGYMPNRVARAMRTRSTGVVGFVTMNFSKEKKTVENIGVHPFMVGLNHALSPTGRHVAMLELNELESQQQDRLPIALREQFFDALVIQFGLSARALRILEERGIPAVYWDSGLLKDKNCVYRDERALTRKLVERLLTLGHRRIAFVASDKAWNEYKSGKPLHHSFMGRHEEYEAVLRERGLKPRIILGYDPAALARQMTQERVTAVLIHGALFDYIPILRAASMMGKNIPEDLSVLACDVEASFQNRGPGLGGARYNRYEAGRMAGDLLLRRLNEGGGDVPSLSLPLEFSDEWSVAPAKRA